MLSVHRASHMTGKWYIIFMSIDLDTTIVLFVKLFIPMLVAAYRFRYDRRSRGTCCIHMNCRVRIRWYLRNDLPHSQHAAVSRRHLFHLSPRTQLGCYAAFHREPGKYWVSLTKEAGLCWEAAGFWAAHGVPDANSGRYQLDWIVGNRS